MTKTKSWLSILAISVVLVAGTLALSPTAIPSDGDPDDVHDDDKLERTAKPDDVHDDDKLERTAKPEIKHSTIEETGFSFTISDSDITPQSVVTFSIDKVSTTPASGGCGVATVTSGSFDITCMKDFLEAGSTVNYIVINP